MAALGKQVANVMDQLAIVFSDVPLEFLARADHDFRGGGRSGGAQVGDKIGDGEIGLVTHAGDYRDHRFENRARDDFFIEGPQIFERAAAARENQHFREFHAIEVAQGRDDVSGGAVSLHAHGIKLHMQIGEAALQNAQDVANGRAGGR